MSPNPTSESETKLTLAPDAKKPRPNGSWEETRDTEALTVLGFHSASFEELAKRALAAGFGFREVDWGRGSKYKYTSAEMDFPRADGVGTVRLMEHDVPKLLKLDFESWRFSGVYQALVDTTTGRIECGLTISVSPSAGTDSVWELPGVEVAADSPLRTEEALEDYAVPAGWKMSVSNSSVSMELSPKSDHFELLYGRYGSSGVTLKILHNDGADGPRVDELLGTFAEDFLLDLEMKFNLGTTLARQTERRKRPENTRSRNTALPEFPRLQYQQDAAAFYWYGLSASEFPLLQYLAFYQVLEYFFSSFTRSATLGRLRSQLKDPGFDLNDDQTLGVLIDSTKTVHAGLKRESDQLQHTLNESVEPEALRNFLRSDQSLIDHFMGAKQKIKGTRPLRLEVDGEDIRAQVADRVYKVRNRIVHTKSGAEEFGLELLLPASGETKYLGPEVELVRWLAQRAMIHGSRLR
jgi:hypothetical protein